MKDQCIRYGDPLIQDRAHVEEVAGRILSLPLSDFECRAHLALSRLGLGIGMTYKSWAPPGLLQLVHTLLNETSLSPYSILVYLPLHFPVRHDGESISFQCV